MITDLELAAAPLFVALTNAVSRCLKSPAYRSLAARPVAADFDALTQRQARMLAAAICDASHDELEAFPPFVELRRVIHIQRRNARIIAAFTGHNYGDLARQWGLSTRQIRRIVASGQKKE